MAGKPLLALDFDGVIHSYASGWKGADKIPDPPVPGAMAFMREALKTFRVAIYSSRSGQPGGIRAMREWLEDWATRDGWTPEDIARIEWPTEKPAAFVGLDDRVLTFTGQWPTIQTLADFKPWTKA